MTTTPGTQVMERLRTETRDLHDKAEHHPFNRALFSGKLPKDRYVAHLSQLLLLHQALEGRLREFCENEPFASVIEEYQYQEPYLVDDLAYFGVSTESIEPTGETAAVITELHECARVSPLEALGMHYVLEGSNNGGRYIAMNVRKAYNLTDRGVRYLDPYGESQKERWEAFKQAMGKHEFTDEQATAILTGANFMFEAVSRMADALHGAPSTIESKPVNGEPAKS